jgi:hypothetical protein
LNDEISKEGNGVNSESNELPPWLTNQQNSENYFRRHWKGRLSLSVSYWINGSLIVGIGTIFSAFVLRTIPELGGSIRLISLASIIFIFGYFSAWVWSVVGIWRSAGHHAERGGNQVWASLARGVVILGGVAMAGQLSTTYIPAIKEYGLLIAGIDSLGEPAEMTVSANGRDIIVRGALVEGTAERFATIVSNAPNARTIVLDSRGGRLLEAMRMAELIRKNQLNTYVEDQCASACTLALIAGVDRAADPNAKIGFHQASFPGMDDETAEANDEFKQLYAKAGIDGDFIRRASEVTSSTMWYPRHDELVAAGVINRQSLGGESSTSISRYRTREEFETELNKNAIWPLLRKKYPEIAIEAVDKAWTVGQRGGTDAQVTNASRAVIAAAYPKILGNAPNDVLDDYISLASDQLSAAKLVSIDACDKFLRSELDITKALPKEYTDREMNLLIRALNSEDKRIDFDETRTTKILESALVGLNDEQIQALVKPAEANPIDRCDAAIAMYKAISKVDAPERADIARLLLTSR